MRQESGITIHYHRVNGDYDSWCLWIWKTGAVPEPLELTSSAKDDFGLVFTIPASYLTLAEGVGLLPKFGDWKQQDSPDRYLSNLAAREVFILQGDSELYTEKPLCSPRIRAAYIDSRTEINLVINTTVPVSVVSAESIRLFDGQNHYSCAAVSPYDPHNGSASVFTATFDKPVDPDRARLCKLSVQLNNTQPVIAVPRYVFDDPFFVTDTWLGTRIYPDKTVFRVWAPAACALNVVMSDSMPLPPTGSQSADSVFPMEYLGQGVWELQRFGSFEHWIYRYDSTLAATPLTPVSVYDPYARAIDRQHTACILIQDRTPIAEPPVFSFSDAVLYELHVRDFTSDDSSGAQFKGTFPGLHTAGTKYPRNLPIKTGCDHCMELGVNTLQLMPVHAFKIDADEGEYQWGYMTEHFNAPEPSYASDANGVTAVRELKQAVDGLHRMGFKVCMDVVYNHTTESHDFACHFNGLAPDYFYRVKPDGSYWNGSGCGNEFRTEGPMARKFLIDSLVYWVTEYSIDGFRFDLMGLIDRNTMNEIVQTLSRIKPGIFLYGEPWSGGDTPIKITGKGTQKGKGFSCFNDSFRIAVSGGVFDLSPGYIFDGRNRDDVIRGWKGSYEWFTRYPYESINYLECHDDRTLRDKISLSAYVNFPDMPAELHLALNRISAFLVLLAQGIPFLHCGQDFCLTKFGEHNTFNRGDEYNKIRWSMKQDYFSVFTYYQGLISLRSAHPVFRMRNKKTIEKCMLFDIITSSHFACEMDCSLSEDTWAAAVALVNPSPAPWLYSFSKHTREWQVFVEKNIAGIAPVRTIIGESYTVAPYSAALLARLK